MVHKQKCNSFYHSDALLYDQGIATALSCEKAGIKPRNDGTRFHSSLRELIFGPAKHTNQDDVHLKQLLSSSTL